jgi:anti-sigma B factor antagonist
MRSPEQFKVTVEPLEDAHLIRADGELDLSTVPMLSSAIDAAREASVPVLLHLADVTFIDSTGLQLLLAASHESATSKWTFFIIRPSEAVLRLIELSGTGDLLTLVDPRRMPSVTAEEVLL